MQLLSSNRPVLPEWTRYSWVSLTERSWWNPIFGDVLHAFRIIERESVVSGLRPAVWLNVAPDELVATSEWATRNKLACLPLTTIASMHGTYASVARTPGPGDLFDYRCLILPFSDVGHIDIHNDEELGKRLGYPACCRQAFTNTWGQGQVDSTYDQLNNTDWKRYTPAIHTMLRFMNIRLVPFMPCSYSCDAAAGFAEQWFNLGRKLGYVDEMAATKEILSWPVEASRLFGISEIVTPAVKISTRTDWTPTKDTFKVDGTYNKPDEWLWKDNGFNDPTVMRQVHKQFINTLVDVLPNDARVLDLGCGNGLLLRRLKMHKNQLRLAGVDINDDAIRHIAFGTGRWMAGRIESDMWHNWKPTHTLISGQRLKEMNPLEIIELQRYAGQLCVYLYEERNVRDPESLESLAARLLPGPFRMLQKTPLLSVGISTAAS